MNMCQHGVHEGSRDSLLARALQDEEMREDQRWLQSEENRNYNSRHSSRPRVSFSYQSWYCLHHFERSADDLNAILRSQGALGRRNDVFPFFLDQRVSSPSSSSASSLLRDHRDSLSILCNLIFSLPALLKRNAQRRCLGRETNTIIHFPLERLS